jgi:uncharacterized protein (TIGR03118 family)
MHRVALSGVLAAFVLSLVLAAAAPVSAAPPGAQYTMKALVSSVPGVANTDANLVNAWGLTRSSTSPWWVSDNGSNATTIYNAAGGLLSIGGNPFQGVQGAPTGAVFSGIAGQFQVGTAASPTTLGTSNFIFDGEDGIISAWRGPPAALPVPAHGMDGAVYKGLAISNGPAGPMLYATDFHNGAVEVFNGSWTNVTQPGMFTDPDIPAGFAPFGIQTIGSTVFVTYAKQDAVAHDDVAGQSLGFVDAYDLTGHLLARVATRGQLNSPWGLAMAPDSFGRFGGDLLVGNFGDGQINAFADTSDGWVPRGTLRDADGGKLTIDGLWALQFGGGVNVANDGTADQLFFTAGPADESEGLFGMITASS